MTLSDNPIGTSWLYLLEPEVRFLEAAVEHLFAVASGLAPKPEGASWVQLVGIGMLLTPFAKEAESASAVANAFLFPMMFLSGTFFPVEMFPA